MLESREAVSIELTGSWLVLDEASFKSLEADAPIV